MQNNRKQSTEEAPAAICKALLVGSAGRYPFNGHFRVSVPGEVGAVLHVAGRVGSSTTPEQSWPGVLTLYKALHLVKGRSRVEMSRNLWDLLLTIPPERLGGSEGRDLTLLAVAEDPEGLLISGVGLGGLMGMVEPRARPVVPPTHPLLGEPGLPTGPPRALAPRLTAEAYVAWCHGEPPTEFRVSDLYNRCGVPQ